MTNLKTYYNTRACIARSLLVLLAEYFCLENEILKLEVSQISQGLHHEETSALRAASDTSMFLLKWQVAHWASLLPHSYLKKVEAMEMPRTTQWS